MSIERVAAVIAVRYIRRVLSLPPLGGADEHLHLLSARLLQRGEIVIPVQDMAGGLDPVAQKCCLHLRDDRSRNLEMHVPPVFAVPRVPAPLIRNFHAPVKPTLPSMTKTFL